MCFSTAVSPPVSLSAMYRCTAVSRRRSARLRWNGRLPCSTSARSAARISARCCTWRSSSSLARRRCCRSVIRRCRAERRSVASSPRPRTRPSSVRSAAISSRRTSSTNAYRRRSTPRSTGAAMSSKRGSRARPRDGGTTWRRRATGRVAGSSAGRCRSRRRWRPPGDADGGGGGGRAASRPANARAVASSRSTRARCSSGTSSSSAWMACVPLPSLSLSLSFSLSLASPPERWKPSSCRRRFRRGAAIIQGFLAISACPCVRRYRETSVRRDRPMDTEPRHLRRERDRAEMDGLVWQRTANYCVPVESRPVPKPDVPHCLGIDEAGRGPVLGPMVYGTCYCPVECKDELKALGVDDSKALTERTRTELFDALQRSAFGWTVRIITARELSAQQTRRDKVNLNIISHNAAIGLIRAVIARGVNVTEVYVDTVGDPAKYEALLKDRFPRLTIAVRKKADSLFPVVSAASICAKVTRDTVLARWRFSEPFLNGRDDVRRFGSGYPGDAPTKAWLAEHFDPLFGFCDLVRFDWSTAKVMMKDRGRAVTWAGGNDAAAKITAFYARKRAAETPDDQARLKTRRAAYFADRGLARVVALP